MNQIFEYLGKQTKKESQENGGIRTSATVGLFVEEIFVMETLATVPLNSFQGKESAIAKVASSAGRVQLI